LAIQQHQQQHRWQQQQRPAVVAAAPAISYRVCHRCRRIWHAAVCGGRHLGKPEMNYGCFRVPTATRWCTFFLKLAVWTKIVNGYCVTAGCHRCNNRRYTRSCTLHRSRGYRRTFCVSEDIDANRYVFLHYHICVHISWSVYKSTPKMSSYIVYDYPLIGCMLGRQAHWPTGNRCRPWPMSIQICYVKLLYVIVIIIIWARLFFTYWH